MKNIYKILIIFFSLAFIGCEQAQEDVKSENDELIVIKTSKSTQASYVNVRSFAGTFFANREANLGASIPGKVEKFNYNPGDFVQKGDVLAEMSAEMLTQAIIEYEALLKNYQRIARLREKGSISEMEYDNIRAKLEASEAKTKMIKNNTSITAPFSGVIVEYLVEEGENYFFNFNLKPGYSHTSGILRLMQLNPLKVVIEVNENDLRYIQEGTKVRVTCPSLNSETISGRVNYIKPILSTTTRTAKVEITVSNPHNHIMPGMYANVTFESDEITGVKIPLNAIYRQPGTPEDFVFVIKNNTANRIKVNRVKTIGEMVFVEGLEPNLVVATEGKNRLLEGSTVKIITK